MNVTLLKPRAPLEFESSTANPEDYHDRNGYLRDFLGAGSDFDVPFPLFKDENDLVRVERAKPGRPFELCYRNFSVAMSRSRKLCCVTGVNIAGDQPFFHPKRPGWKTDPRVPKDLQVGGEFYVPTSFDRGHMVRRLDPVWGVEGDALLANSDTHHYTNSCPQVHSFNDVTWGNLEDWILSQEQSRDSRGTVFTGPIFQRSDPVHPKNNSKFQIKVPVDFYKVVVVVDDAVDKLSVTAFRQSQRDVMPSPEPALEAPFDPGQFVVDQVTVAALEQDSGINFGRLKEFDVLAKQPAPEGAGEPTAFTVRLTSSRDAILWTPQL